ncbi:hypothetical protein ACHAQA_006732 [Verticillium albo-atrum]
MSGTKRRDDAVAQQQTNDLGAEMRSNSGSPTFFPPDYQKVAERPSRNSPAIEREETAHVDDQFKFLMDLTHTRDDSSSDADESVHRSNADRSVHQSDDDESDHYLDADESVHHSDADESAHHSDHGRLNDDTDGHALDDKSNRSESDEDEEYVEVKKAIVKARKAAGKLATEKSTKTRSEDYKKPAVKTARDKPVKQYDLADKKRDKTSRSNKASGGNDKDADDRSRSAKKPERPVKKRSRVENLEGSKIAEATDDANGVSEEENSQRSKSFQKPKKPVKTCQPFAEVTDDESEQVTGQGTTTGSRAKWRTKTEALDALDDAFKICDSVQSMDLKKEVEYYIDRFYSKVDEQTAKVAQKDLGNTKAAVLSFSDLSPVRSVKSSCDNALKAKSLGQDYKKSMPSHAQVLAVRFVQKHGILNAKIASSLEILEAGRLGKIPDERRVVNTSDSGSFNPGTRSAASHKEEADFDPVAWVTTASENFDLVDKATTRVEKRCSILEKRCSILENENKTLKNEAKTVKKEVELLSEGRKKDAAKFKNIMQTVEETKAIYKDEISKIKKDMTEGFRSVMSKISKSSGKMPQSRTTNDSQETRDSSTSASSKTGNAKASQKQGESDMP